MRALALTVSSVAVGACLVVVACGPKQDPNAANMQGAQNPQGQWQGGPPPAGGQPVGPDGQPQQGWGGAPGQQPGQPAPGQPMPGQQPGAPAQGGWATAPQGTAPGAAPQGPMAVPGPLAFPCQDDRACGFHRCNVQYGKCAFPCATDVDCAANTHCFSGVCLMKPPGQ